MFKRITTTVFIFLLCCTTVAATKTIEVILIGGQSNATGQQGNRTKIICHNYSIFTS